MGAVQVDRILQKALTNLLSQHRPNGARTCRRGPGGTGGMGDEPALPVKQAQVEALWIGDAHRMARQQR